jgi:hypothetical protein
MAHSLENVLRRIAKSVSRKHPTQSTYWRKLLTKDFPLLILRISVCPARILRKAISGRPKCCAYFLHQAVSPRPAFFTWSLVREPPRQSRCLLPRVGVHLTYREDHCDTSRDRSLVPGRSKPPPSQRGAFGRSEAILGVHELSAPRSTVSPDP